MCAFCPPRREAASARRRKTKAAPGRYGSRFLRCGIRKQLLGRQNFLREPDGVDGAQRWSARRQARGPQGKVGVKGVVTRAGRTVNAGALIGADGLTVVIETYHRTSVVAYHAPVFQEAEEIVHTAVRAEVLRLSANGREWNALTGNDRGAVRRGHCSPVIGVEGESEGVHVVPVVGKERDRVAFDGCGDAGAAPGSVVHRRVVIALDVNRVFRNDAKAIGSAAGGSDVERGSVYDFQGAAEEDRRIFPSFLRVAVGHVRTIRIKARTVGVGEEATGVGDGSHFDGSADHVS